MNFFESVYAKVCEIPRGQVMTYGQVAKLIGTKDSRRVGHALHANRDPKVPCHRVVFADGSLASGYAFGGAGEQRKKLMEEGVQFKDGRVVFDTV